MSAAAVHPGMRPDCRGADPEDLHCCTHILVAFLTPLGCVHKQICHTTVHFALCPVNDVAHVCFEPPAKSAA